MSDEYYSSRAEDFMRDARKRISQGDLSPFKRRGISDTFFNAGESYRRAGKIEEARRAYLKSGAYSPNPNYTNRAKQAINLLNEKYAVKKNKRDSSRSGIEKKVHMTPGQKQSLERSRKQDEQYHDLRKKFDSGESPLGDFKTGILSFMAIVTLLIGLFFVSADFTGYVIANPLTNDMQWIGICFFTCGLFFTFLAVRKKYFSKHL